MMASMYSLSPVDESILGLDFMEVVVLAIGFDAGVVVFDVTEPQFHVFWVSGWQAIVRTMVLR